MAVPPSSSASVPPSSSASVPARPSDGKSAFSSRMISRVPTAAATPKMTHLVCWRSSGPETRR